MSIGNYFKTVWEENKVIRREIFLNLVKELSVTDYLDVGCHNGSATVKIASACGATNVYGVEKDDGFIKESHVKGIKVVKSDLNHKLPFKNESFDLITGDQVIEHLWDLDMFISELKRVLRFNGKLIIGTENLASTHNIFALLMGLQPFSTNVSTKFVIGYHPSGEDILNYSIKTGDHKRVLSYKSLKSLFECYEFTNVSMYSCGYIPFKGLMARFMNRLDSLHSQFIIVEGLK